MKGLKFISFLLLVNILILVGHNLMPHHHHVASVTHPSSHECPVTNQEHHDGNSGSKHCHAFNDINFVKLNHSQVPMAERLSSFAMMANPEKIPEPHTRLTISPRLLLESTILSSELTRIHSLRGPPELS